MDYEWAAYLPRPIIAVPKIITRPYTYYVLHGTKFLNGTANLYTAIPYKFVLISVE